MFTAFRRPLAVATSALMLHATISPTVLMASEAPGPTPSREYRPITTQSLTLFDQDGTELFHAASNNVVPGAKTRFADSYRVATPESLAVLRAELVKYGKSTKRRQGGVAMTLLVLDAHAAPTEAEYLRRIRELPITVTKQSAFNQAGQRGTRTDYRYKGNLRARRFVATGSGTQGTSISAPDESAGEPGASASEEAPSDESSVGTPISFVNSVFESVGLAPPTECEYVDEYYVTHVDECATEEQIDAAIAEGIAITAEGEFVIAEEEAAEAEFDAWCQQNEERCFPSTQSGPSGEDRDKSCGGERFLVQLAVGTYIVRSVAMAQAVGALMAGAAAVTVGVAVSALFVPVGLFALSLGAMIYVMNEAETCRRGTSNV